jgi:CubicO group peptidase (beta-lactamase class C family)
VQTTAPDPTSTQPSQAVNHLPTPTPQLSGELGSEIDEYLRKNYPLFSGSILVSLDGEILLSSGYRYANWELNVPNTSSTIFRLTSLTKPFTALAIMMLQERGKLDVHDPICRYLADCPTAWEPITIHHLLTHTSGIPDYAAFPNALPEAASSRSVTELIDTFRDKPPEFPPGTRFEYSNSGYVLLGAVIESVSGTSYGGFLFNNIFSPLSMRDTGYDVASQIIKNRAGGYTIDGRTLENSSHIDPSNLYSAGGLYSTIEDLYLWNQALNTTQLVTQPTLDKIFTPQVVAPKYGAEYGYGWIISESEGHPLVWHAGSLPGFHNYLAHYPDDQLDIIILSNLDTSDVPAIARGIEEIIFQQAK